MARAALDTTPREAVVAAAARVFVRDGFQSASLREIAAEAGLTTGAIYSNFDGKGDLFLAVLEEKLDPRLELMYEAARDAPTGGVGARVGEQFAAYLKQRRRWLILLIEFWAQSARDPKLSRKFGDRHAKLRAAISEVLAERAATNGVSLVLPPGELAMLLVALTNGMAVEQLADPSGVPGDLYGKALDLLLV